MMNHKTYREMVKFKTFEERYEYLKMSSVVGDSKFGHNRWVNQNLYKSKEWRNIRRFIIARDNGCDLGDCDRPILNGAIVHHINPISYDDIISGSDCIFDPDNLVLVSYATHTAIHFGDDKHIIKLPPERRKGDTTPWLTLEDQTG